MELEIKKISTIVLSECEENIEGIDTINCVMCVTFGIFINEIQKSTFDERVSSTYFNTMTGIEMDAEREKSINDFITNFKK